MSNLKQPVVERQEQKGAEMPKQQSIHDYLPKHEGKKIPVQAKVRASLYLAADEKREQEGYTWVEIVEAALQAYIAKK
jgi:hypothetical protein